MYICLSVATCLCACASVYVSLYLCLGVDVSVSQCPCLCMCVYIGVSVLCRYACAPEFVSVFGVSTSAYVPVSASLSVLLSVSIQLSADVLYYVKISTLIDKLPFSFLITTSAGELWFEVQMPML